jgi:hypothetical protein
MNDNCSGWRLSVSYLVFQHHCSFEFDSVAREHPGALRCPESAAAHLHGRCYQIILFIVSSCADAK